MFVIQNFVLKIPYFIYFIAKYPFMSEVDVIGEQFSLWWLPM